jgi:hypothetical protein
MRDLPKLKLNLSQPETFGNLAKALDQDARRSIAIDLTDLIHTDETSMSEWAGKAQGYLDELDSDEGNEVPQNREQEGAGDEPPPATEMTLAAMIQFAARATDALLGEPDLAKASEPGGEALAAWVSTQLRTVDPNWTLDTDPMVMHFACTGLAWRKRDFDDSDRVFHSHFVPSVGSNSVIINSNVRSIERAPRVTHQFERYPYEIERSISRKKWIDYEPQFDEFDPQAPKQFYEIDAWLDFDDDGIEEPWTVTISRDDFQEIVRLRPRWTKKTIVHTKEVLYFNPIRRFYPYMFLPDPKGGFFPMGFGKLLNRTEAAADVLLAAITDTAKTESQNGGVMAGGGIGLPDKVEVKGNRVVTVNTDGAPLANRFQAWPSKSVSPGSVQVLEKVMTVGDRLAGTLNLLENAPASMTATMAKGIIDTGTQVQSAVHRRLVTSMTQEFRMFVQMADAYGELPNGMSATDGNGVAVTADPQLATEMHRSAMGGVYLQMTENPAFNPFKAALRFCQIMRIPNPEELVGQPQQPQATPDEKMKGALGLMKEQREGLKTKAGVAVQLTQALKNMVDAGGGMVDIQAATLQMAQLEQTVQQLMQDAQNAGSGFDGMAQQPANQNPPSGAAPPQGGNGADLSGGADSGPGGAGPGSGLA